MTKHRALGRGLHALIPVGMPLEEHLVEVALDEIKGHVWQSRTGISEEELDGLAASIRAHGLVHPIVVRPRRDGGYDLVAGERRWRACRALGMERVPAVVRTCDDLSAAAMALIENLQREDLRPLEEAQAYKRLMEEFGLTQEELARRVGKSRAAVANALRLLGLGEEARQLLEAGRLSAGHGRALAAVADPLRQAELARRAAAKGWSVRTLESEVRSWLEGRVAVKRRRTRDPELGRLERELARRLSRRVVVRGTREGGRLEIHFSSWEDLQALLRDLGMFHVLPYGETGGAVRDG
ncbi:MAG: ParB/RepB/Spo0J family partition protein [Desulfotomaculales bacterium]